MTQRDVFLSRLFELAKVDKDVILMAADMGAPSIDKWKSDLPDQFFSMGISEQNTINVASGFSNRGKKVYVYFMACWSARCLEQIRYSCSIGNNPITILGCGVGLGYAPAGPAHNPTDDIAYMKTVCNMEIYSPATNYMVEKLVDYTYNNRVLSYIRLERTYDTRLDLYYSPSTVPQNILKQGMFKTYNRHSDICILTSGYLLGRALSVSEKIGCDVIDLFRIDKINRDVFVKTMKDYFVVANLEEQTVNCGGFCSMVCRTMMENSLFKPVLNFQLPEKYLLENGNREFLLNKYDLSADYIAEQIERESNKRY